MIMYKHLWYDKVEEKTVTDETPFVTSIEEAISCFHEEKHCYRKYYTTLALDEKNKTYEWLDIKEVILQQEVDNMTPGQRAEQIELARADEAWAERVG